MNAPARRLYRARKDRVLAGVCGGFGKYFHLDPVLFRIFWACFALFSAGIGAGLVYLIFWIATPEEPGS